MRSIASLVLPVLVGPSTAVTPEPGARPLPDSEGGGDESAMFYWVSAPSNVGRCDGAKVIGVSECDVCVMGI